MIRSLNIAVALACLIVLVTCLFTAQQISKQTEETYFEPVFHRMDRMEVQDARTALENGGLSALRRYLDRLDGQFGGKHLLLDANGHDVDGGADHSDMLPPYPAMRSRTQRHGIFELTQATEDRKYWFAAVGMANDNVSFTRFYLLLVIVVAVLGFFASAYIVLPLRRMAAVVERFGMGNMSARLRSRRSDEIGALAKSYDDMADRLEASVNRGRQLIQDVSHELRAPLTRMSFTIELARSAPDPNVAMDEVKRDLQRLSFLVSELTALSMVPLGNVNLDDKRELVDLEAIVLDAVHDCELEAKAKSCTIVCVGSAPELICGEPEHLNRAVGNVLRNAVRHSPEGAELEVGLRQEAGWSTVTVRDHGPGVPKEMLERIFDPFFQVDPARSASAGGLGLGLSIARRSVETHRGTVTAENAVPGLRVSIRVPRDGSVGVAASAK